LDAQGIHASYISEIDINPGEVKLATDYVTTEASSDAGLLGRHGRSP